MHVVLLGDSIFDNGSYTRSEPDVVPHLRSVLAAGWRATLCAVDRDDRQPGPPTRAGAGGRNSLRGAIGGNDALQHTDLLERRVSSTAEALALFAERMDGFEADYRAALAPVLALKRATLISTIYNGNLEPPRARLARVALTLFNDVIVRFGFEHRLPVIDLRLVCCEAGDYANPIELSGRGGLKIARAIAAAIAA